MMKFREMSLWHKRLSIVAAVLVGGVALDYAALARGRGSFLTFQRAFMT